ncbi:GntR family transcriptional regulator [Phaeobacter sp. C3_T13_0]|uniref:GntR family transcriptional regulator n=1 Tax=Phaeobacter cretensis TaxID=3342641 RepID=UPI0039BC9335
MSIAKLENANLGEKIYEDLRLRLIVGDLAPDDRLSIRKLADEFNVSTMPVREALKRLETEKALVGSAKRAYRVPDISAEDAEDLFFVRATLEGAGAERAISFLTSADLERLRRYASKMDDAWSRFDAHDFLLNNFHFHSLIYQSTRNSDLSEIAETLYARSGPWLGRAIREFAEQKDWANEHHDIIDAFEAGDAKRVRELIESDVNWGSTYFSERERRAVSDG